MPYVQASTIACRVEGTSHKKALTVIAINAIESVVKCRITVLLWASIDSMFAGIVG